MKIKHCKQCGKKIENIFNIFCNHSCSAKYNNVRRPSPSQEQRKRVSDSIKWHYNLGKSESLYYLNCKFCKEKFVHKHNKKEYCKKCDEIKAKDVILKLMKYYNIDNIPKLVNHITSIINSGISISYISEVNNINPGLIHYFMKHYGIKAKYTSYFDRNGTTKFPHTTWFGKELFLRSGYEKLVADRFDDLKITYEYETIKIPIGNNRNYYPDFFIPDINLLIEVKGENFYIKDKKEIIRKIEMSIEKGYNFLLLNSIEKCRDCINLIENLKK